MPLTDAAIRNAKPGEKTTRLFDEKGLYLEITTKGQRWWRLKYRYLGKEKRLSLGVYPDVGLTKARDHRDEARQLLAEGIDPSEARKRGKLTKFEAADNSFQAVAKEWWLRNSREWSEDHRKRTLRRLEKDLFPWMGKRPIAELKAPEVLRVLRRIEDRGAIETAHRAMQTCGQVFRYAVSTGRAERGPTADLMGALPPLSRKHHASITDTKAIGALLRDLDGYEGSLRQPLRPAAGPPRFCPSW